MSMDDGEKIDQFIHGENYPAFKNIKDKQAIVAERLAALEEEYKELFQELPNGTMDHLYNHYQMYIGPYLDHRISVKGDSYLPKWLLDRCAEIYRDVLGL